MNFTEKNNSILEFDDFDTDSGIVDITVIKRDGTEEDYEQDKVSNSIMQAALKVGGEDYQLADDLAEQLTNILLENGIDKVESAELETLIKNLLIDEGHSSTATEYIIFSAERNKIREMNTTLIKTYEDITFKSGEESDSKRENANINSDTAMGTMLKYGSEGAKMFNLMYLMKPEHANAHKNGDIHIHDLDFFSLAWTCDHIPLDKLFKDGFNTGHGYLREPGNIRTAGALAAIAIQSNQNDMYGGQAIPLFDYYLAPYVALTYVKRLSLKVKERLDLEDKEYNVLRSKLIDYHKKNKLVMHKEGLSDLDNIVRDFLNANSIEYTDKAIKKVFENTHKEVYDETYQSMEAFIHNMNTLHSRAGSQVPFSSINFGTDTSVEGRMVIETFLLSAEKGLGYGEIAIFPISIFKLKAGVNYNEDDPNYDLFKLACRVSAKTLYPNFLNLDATYNAELYVEGRPETEMATMGCRTRVGKNVYDPDKSVIPGRGNLSFTSINLPRLAIKSKGDIELFYKLLDKTLELVHDQLLERFEIQCMRHMINHPFLLGQGNWLGSDRLGPTDDIRAILKHGTMAVGFIGLAETLVALTGKHHGESEEAQKLGLEIIGHMREMTDAWAEEEKMNYGLIGTPAEGLSGRFVRIDKEKYGVIKGVTDKEYYTNSSHVPVWYNISAFKKIQIEAPYHSLESGGHILYIELDGDTSKNIKAFMKIIKCMYDNNAGYFSINHPVDRDPVCGYVGVIGDTCPRCGRKEGEAMTMETWMKLKGYAGAGNADTLGYAGNPDEEMDRIPNKLSDASKIKFERKS